MPSDYIPILIFVLAASFIAAFALILPHYLGPRRPNKAKSETIESGKLSYGDARRRGPGPPRRDPLPAGTDRSGAPGLRRRDPARRRVL